MKRAAIIWTNILFASLDFYDAGRTNIVNEFPVKITDISIFSGNWTGVLAPGKTNYNNTSLLFNPLEIFHQSIIFSKSLSPYWNGMPTKKWPMTRN